MPLTRIKNTAIGDGGISTAKLADGAVTTVKVADSAVNSAKIGVDVIAAEDLAANSVTVSEISDDAVTTAKLATQTGNVDFADNAYIRLGDSQDLQIFHNGSNSYIDEVGTGNLRIRAVDLEIMKAGTAEMMIKAVADGAVTLYHDNLAKLATAATGVNVTGSSGATLTLTSTDTSGADTELLGQIDFVSSDVSGGSAGTQARIKGVYEDNGDSSGIAFLTGFSTGSGSPTLNEVMRIRHEGNVGIGTISPTDPLTVIGSATIGNTTNAPITTELHVHKDFAGGTATFGSESSVVISTNTTGPGTQGYIGSLWFGSQDVTSSAQYGWNLAGMAGYVAGDTGTGGASADLLFYTASSSQTGTERMRINANGNLLLNRTTDLDTSMIAISQPSGKNAISIQAPNTNPYMAMQFYNSTGGRVGYIQYSNTATTYSTSSDYRLKENVTTDWDATTRLKQLNPVRFNFISDADTTVDGFLAHEVQDIVPEAITGEKDGMRDEEYEVTPAVVDEDGNVVTPAVMATRSVPDYQGIDQGKLVPLLVKSLQEALADIDTLKAEVAALKNA
jgi:hypothetical protein